jgi:hypothetical protein
MAVQRPVSSARPPRAPAPSECRQRNRRGRARNFSIAPHTPRPPPLAIWCRSTMLWDMKIRIDPSVGVRPATSCRTRGPSTAPPPQKHGRTRDSRRAWARRIGRPCRRTEPGASFADAMRALAQPTLKAIPERTPAAVDSQMRGGLTPAARPYSMTVRVNPFALQVADAFTRHQGRRDNARK